ncbi:MAG: hypothetical protein PVI03_07490 [Candidatus Thorarchaeota archaeon]|jgi:hypothetical protein
MRETLLVGEIRNLRRRALLDMIDIAMKAHAQRTIEDGAKFLFQAIDFAKEFDERSRGKGKAKSFIKSVANARNNTTYFPPEKRNGSKECQRRLAQLSR